MLFRILGPTEVIADSGEPIALTSNKQQLILALLLMHANEVVPVERIIDALWPGDDMPQRPRRYHVSKLRDLLDPGRKGVGSHRVIDRDGPGPARHAATPQPARMRVTAPSARTNPRSCTRSMRSWSTTRAHITDAAG